ncbi:HlyD family efflux transporter periplasmic adaptor subunit [Psychrobium sp. 1_MG-2023]|uniref:HlyD family efflux transporter periplasmic adaptor subunit n=1 Tax=Psychrobium sp. 1_MG-2023 TaxID=3062624 RepID=UPI000C32D76C|nr:HlyD family efflux transporter periplasmic adaptor subunit [Psychrobium sp. 1_MG-2023]MDP2562559.1 HlyD family efflux transporter periplasmic adaptor subunit [Psychrobium sp. 1_MG-2023]PKF54421.1 hemolysin secretion protein D [Alteromonadales bacterium alter-6D02]
MLFDHFFADDEVSNKKAALRLENYYKRNYSVVLWLLLLGLIAFTVWSSVYRIDQVARATGEVIASSRVQIIQSVDGGVLATLNVKEGDTVAKGQVIATLDQTRIGAAVKEIEVRLSALKAKATRLRAEVVDSKELVFSDELLRFPDLVKVEQALFKQKRTGLYEELRTLEVAVELAREEAQLIESLSKSGDVNRTEVIRSARALNDAEAKLINRKNKYLEQVSTDLAKAEDEIAQNEQILAQRQQQLADSVFTAVLPGIVKNVRVTTIGGVLRAGEELMQIIPVGDELIIEAKVSPADIAQVQKGLSATIRFDPFDYTIYGGVIGEVVYVSGDTLKEETGRGEEIYYRVHVTSQTSPVTTTSGRTLEILPGMTAQVDIKTSDRTVMDYLLKPLKKTLSESFGER